MSYLKFEDRGTSDSGKTKRWVVLNSLSNAALGWVQWYSGFRKYVYEGLPGTKYDAGCMREIANFIEAKTIDHKS
jgi:NADH:ubiquinone oxidoreductase subunit